MILDVIYLRINPARYHYLKFILEAYDGLCLLSTVPGKKGCVAVRFPLEQQETLIGVLTQLAASIGPQSLGTSSPSPNTPSPMHSKTFYIKTFGCQMNERDSEIMAQLLGEKGYQATNDSDHADLIILNTCSIRAKAEQKVMSLLGVLRKQKKRNPRLKICVAGCVAQQEGQHLIERMPHVDLVVGTQNIYQVAELLEDSQAAPVVISLADDYHIPAFIPDLSHAPGSNEGPVYKKFLTIMQGCNNYCTYCVVPHTRGREVSRTVADILGEAHALVDAGVKEITLLGQNVNSYGKTNHVSEASLSYNFSDLLREVAEISGLKRLRFTSSNPKDLSDELMRCFAEVEILCPHFHLPVQSGSDRILSLMNRKYSRRLYLEKVAALRSYCPEITITTDMIIGFPGETDQDFEETMSLLEEVRYHGSYSFKYSDRPGTRSSTFEEKIDESIKSQRLHRFQTAQDAICLAHNQGYVDKDVAVMIEKNRAGAIVARTGSNHLVHIAESSAGLRPGDIVPVRVDHAGHHSLQGKLL